MVLLCTAVDHTLIADFVVCLESSLTALTPLLRCFTSQPGHSVGMLAAVEHGPILCSDSNILCLSWKGRVPKSEKDKPVCRRRYYEEGWLATGNGRGVVGVTFTSSHCRRDRTTPQRINFNLRGHNSEVRPYGCHPLVFILIPPNSSGQWHILVNWNDIRFQWWEIINVKRSQEKYEVEIKK